MNDQWQRIIEIERRQRHLEQQNRSLINKLTRAAQSVQSLSAYPPTAQTPPGTEIIGAVHRFPTEYTIRVEWDTEPTLITGASSNPTADVTSLAEAVAFLETGMTLNLANEMTENRINQFLYDTETSKAALYMKLDFEEFVTISSTTQTAAADFRLALFDDGGFLADPEEPTYSGALFQASIPPISSGTQTIRIGVAWPRRNGGGTVIGASTLWGRRNVASEDEFIDGPTYGVAGSWSFSMTGSATSFNEEGTGTLYLEW